MKSKCVEWLKPTGLLFAFTEAGALISRDPTGKHTESSAHVIVIPETNKINKQQIRIRNLNIIPLLIKKLFILCFNIY